MMKKKEKFLNKKSRTTFKQLSGDTIPWRSFTYLSHFKQIQKFFFLNMLIYQKLHLGPHFLYNKYWSTLKPNYKTNLKYIKFIVFTVIKTYWPNQKKVMNLVQRTPFNIYVIKKKN